MLLLYSAHNYQPPVASTFSWDWSQLVLGLGRVTVLVRVVSLGISPSLLDVLMVEPTDTVRHESTWTLVFADDMDLQERKWKKIYIGGGHGIERNKGLSQQDRIKLWDSF